MCRFDSVEETFEPVADGKSDHSFISKSYDATRSVCLPHQTLMP
jgi:hypothetical protein